MLADRAFAWARTRTLDELSAMLCAESRRSSRDEAELFCHVEDRACRVVLWFAEAEVELALSKPVLPASLEIKESSHWGPQKYEAWSSGDAAKVEDQEFDAAFVVVGKTRGTRPSPEEARALSPRLKAVLLGERARIRGGSITAEYVKLRVRASGRPRQSRAGRPTPNQRARERLAWTLGAIFLGFGTMPTARDLGDAVTFAVDLVKALEDTTPI
jgi:hypothetical protein